MVTTKKRIRASSLKFRKEWVVDPGPEFFKQLGLDRMQQRELTQAKKEFQARVNEILAKTQR
jgi:hypothetical protein